jgi:menaquinone-dependent protoporphyrinogen oxidase
MVNRILVAYATKCGSTAEIATAIGKLLSSAGAEVDVRRVQDVKDVKGYQAVVIGSATRMEKILPEAIDFANRHRRVLQQIPTAYFTVGVTMVEDTAENRAKAAGYLEPLCQIKRPASLGLFAGKVDHARLDPFTRFALSWVKEGPLAGGDFRNWDAINAWAQGLVPLMAA